MLFDISGDIKVDRAGIVVGSAPCLHHDLKAALKRYPDAFILTVNGACVEVEHVDAILAGHTNKAEQFTKARRAIFPDSEFEVWASWARRGREPKAEYPSVTRWFGPDVISGATSAAKGVLMLLQAGYGPVIMCGCPLDGSGYFDGESKKGHGIGHDCRRVGDPAEQDNPAIQSYREKFKRNIGKNFKGRVFSMSGFTREVLGAPDGTD